MFVNILSAITISQCKHIKRCLKLLFYFNKNDYTNVKTCIINYTCIATSLQDFFQTLKDLNGATIRTKYCMLPAYRFIQNSRMSNAFFLKLRLKVQRSSKLLTNFERKFKKKGFRKKCAIYCIVIKKSKYF